eukprot:15469756-Alexandrium_andersonii.AAC.1
MAHKRLRSGPAKERAELDALHPFTAQFRACSKRRGGPARARARGQRQVVKPTANAAFAMRVGGQSSSERKNPAGPARARASGQRGVCTPAVRTAFALRVGGQRCSREHFVPSR